MYVIPKYPEYSIDDNLNIYSHKWGKCRLLTKSLNSDGYPRVQLMHGGRKYVVTVHRIVAMVFLDNYSHNMEINHINGIKQDYSISNLEMCTRSYNLQHAYDTGLRVNPRGHKHYLSNLSRVEVSLIRSMAGKMYQKDLAEIFSVSQGTVSKIQLGITYK